jgi:hypothetical protein
VTLVLLGALDIDGCVQVQRGAPGNEPPNRNPPRVSKSRLSLLRGERGRRARIGGAERPGRRSPAGFDLGFFLIEAARRDSTASLLDKSFPRICEARGIDNRHTDRLVGRWGTAWPRCRDTASTLPREGSCVTSHNLADLRFGTTSRDCKHRTPRRRSYYYRSVWGVAHATSSGRLYLGLISIHSCLFLGTLLQRSCYGLFV